MTRDCVGDGPRRGDAGIDVRVWTPTRLRPVALALIVGGLGSVACAGDDATSHDSIPEFAAPLNLPGTPNGVASGGQPAAVGTGMQAGVTPEGNGASEGNVTPASVDPSGAGGATSVGSSMMATPGASPGGSASISPGGAGGLPGSSEGAAGSGMIPVEPPVGSPPVEPAAPPASSCPDSALFCDDFEDDATGQFPGAPWQDNTGSGATVRVDGVQAFSGQNAVHVNAPPNGAYRRGYFSLEQGSSSIFPAVSRGMFGRAMMFLDATPNTLSHWTIVQAEGRAADGTHDAYYRYGGQQQGGSGIMANYETNDNVSTDCYSHSATRMPVQRWACVEWHFDVARSEMQLWLDGTELTDVHVVDRPTTPGSGCLGNDVNGEWLAPPAFTTLHLGWENYQAASNDRNLWVDDVAIGTERMGCPAP
jgi:polysaccharide lyase-like protein